VTAAAVAAVTSERSTTGSARNHAPAAHSTDAPATAEGGSSL
jgi:hypothetical protein